MLLIYVLFVGSSWIGEAESCFAQTVAGLPEEQSVRLQQILSQNEAAAFVEDAVVFWKLRKDWTPEETNAVRELLGQRAEQIVDATEDLSALDLGVSQALLSFASASMDAAEKQALKQRVESSFQDGADANFGELQARISLTSGLASEPREQLQSARTAVANWMAAHQLEELSQAQLNTCFRLLLPGVRGYDGFHVVWTGFITAPRSGAYRFSISPWNINTVQVEDGELYTTELTVDVRVNGESVLHTDPTNWKHEGVPIELTAGEAVPLRVELTYKYTSNDHHRVCPAQLFWAAEGVPRSIVPASALTRTESGEPGLEAEYTWQEQAGQNPGPQRTERVVDPNIDFVWADALTIASRDEQGQRLAGELARRWRQPAGDFVGDIARRPQMVVLLSGANRERCLESLVEQPQLLAPISRSSIERFYTATRCGADEAAVDVLGTWMTRHDYMAPEMAVDLEQYFDLNHEFNFRLAQFLAVENPQAMQWLEERYLEPPDGNCCLNVADALSECYLVQGRVQEWIEVLDARLADASLAGDKRVDWLIARSNAEELKYATANRYFRTREELLAGQGWLDEASLFAESPAAHVRIARERLARLATLGRWEAVEQELPSTLNAARDGQIDVSTLTANLEKLKVATVTRRQDAEAAENDLHIQEFERRRVLASQQGDLESVRSYNALISTLRAARDAE